MRFTILCVDEYGLTGIEFSTMLKDLAVSIVNAKDETEALERLSEGKISISTVIWTVNSVDLKDFEAIKRLKGKERYKELPVIIVSKFTDKKYIIKAIEAGAVEYIAKPYDEANVLKKVCKVLGVSYEKAKSKILDEDILIFNFSEMMNREIKSASRGGHPLCIIMLGVVPDNRQHGSTDAAGEVLRVTCRVVRSLLRDTDTIFQYDTDTLALLLPFTDKSSIKIVEEKIRAAFITHSSIKKVNSGYRLVLASVCYPEDGKVKDRLLEKLESSLGSGLVTNNIQ